MLLVLNFLQTRGWNKKWITNKVLVNEGDSNTGAYYSSAEKAEKFYLYLKEKENVH